MLRRWLHEIESSSHFAMCFAVGAHPKHLLHRLRDSASEKRRNRVADLLCDLGSVACEPEVVVK